MALLIPAGYTAVSQHLAHASGTRDAVVTYAVITGLRADVTNIANECHNLFSAGLKALIDNSVSIVECDVRTGTSTPGEPIVGTSTVPLVAGTKSQASLPPNNALLVTKRTARGGRRGRGRMFFPWVVGATDPSELGVIGSTVVSAWNTALASWLSALNTADLEMCLLHNEGITDAGDPNVVISLTADQLLSSQRRRLGR